MINLNLMDRITQQVIWTSPTTGTIKTYDNAIELHSVDFSNPTTPNNVPGEIALLMDNIRVMLSTGSPGIVSLDGINISKVVTVSEYAALVAANAVDLNTEYNVVADA